MLKRVAVITGAASGIGEAIAVDLANHGYHIVAADRQARQGQQVAEALGGRFVAADVSRRDDCQRLVQTALKTHGRLDILVNNAGYQHIDKLEVFPEDIWENMLGVMLTAPFLLMKYAWPAMQHQAWGRIINIASIHGLVASPFKSAYVAAKHGLIGLTRTAALEGGPHGITVNAICPAYVRTPLVENQIAAQAAANDIPAQDVIEKLLLEPAAIKRLIEPEEVAALVTFLCSDAAASMTGAALTMDLGWTAR